MIAKRGAWGSKARKIPITQEGWHIREGEEGTGKR